MGADLNEAGVHHLPAHGPGDEVAGGVVLHIDHDGNHHLGLKLLKDWEGQVVVAAVAVVKGDEDGLFRQGLSRRQLPGENRGVAVVLEPLEILPQPADRDGHVVALLAVLHHMVVHQNRQLFAAVWIPGTAAGLAGGQGEQHGRGQQPR